MSPRRSKKRPYGKHVELDYSRLRYVESVQTGNDGASYNVRHINSSPKTYICPGCLQDILPGVSHIVAWETDHFFGADRAAQERRHWHSNCWKRGLRPQ
ncbi:hypothetical protein [Actinomyces sp. zg-332]|uniref:hypothetical protein n=1 Tax=Actinomyces sp. zg-332 TaxID=2708340 RepID=UPI0018C1FBA4|nr:hypothetical protein [Actinomyces sp. zg-332]